MILLVCKNHLQIASFYQSSNSLNSFNTSFNKLLGCVKLTDVNRPAVDINLQRCSEISKISPGSVGTAKIENM